MKDIRKLNVMQKTIRTILALVATVLLALPAAPLWAQSEGEGTLDMRARLPQDMVTARSGATLASARRQAGPRAESVDDAGRRVPADALWQPADTLHLPTLTAQGQVRPFCLQPLYWGGWNSWSLHPGLNVQLGASVFAQFGKHAKGGAGFAQSLSAMYAIPVNSRLSVAVGGYVDNVMWQRDSWREAGLSAVMGYRINDHWEAYLYGQKQLMSSRYMPYSLYDMARLGDRIGAAVKYNVNQNISFQVSVEGGWMPKARQPFFDRHEYPVPRP